MEIEEVPLMPQPQGQDQPKLKESLALAEMMLPKVEKLLTSPEDKSLVKQLTDMLVDLEVHQIDDIHELLQKPDKLKRRVEELKGVLQTVKLE